MMILKKQVSAFLSLQLTLLKNTQKLEFLLDFLKALMGGCSTPISALAEISNGVIHFRGNIFSLDGKEKTEIEKKVSIENAVNSGTEAAAELLNNGGRKISEAIRNAKK